jgi:hypothetical protein
MCDTKAVFIVGGAVLHTFAVITLQEHITFFCNFIVCDPYTNIRIVTS